MTDQRTPLLRLSGLGWTSCQPDNKPPCLHHPYWDLNDPHSVEEATERSAGREERMLLCIDGEGAPDWAGYADEYVDSLSLDERERRAAKARERQGFA